MHIIRGQSVLRAYFLEQNQLLARLERIKAILNVSFVLKLCGFFCLNKYNYIKLLTLDTFFQDLRLSLHHKFRSSTFGEVFI